MKTTHYEGTFTAEIEYGDPYVDSYGKRFKMPAAMSDFLPPVWKTLVIYHESEITADTSGDRDTPNGAEDVETSLVRAEVNGQRLPQELAEQLFELFRDRIEEQVAERDL